MNVMRHPRTTDSPLEAAFTLQLRELKQRWPGLPAWRRNHVFLAGRKFELDYAWPELWFGLEIDGAVHLTRERFHGDREKQALALIAGWKILPVTGLHVRDLRAIGWCEEMLRRLASTPAVRPSIYDVAREDCQKNDQPYDFTKGVEG